MNGDEVLRLLEQHRKKVRAESKQYIDLQRLHMRYGYEGFLRRLEKSAYRRDFVLKGAMLLVTLDALDTRNTKDADFQVYGRHTPASLKMVFAEICAIACDDGLAYSTVSIEVNDAGGEREYPGFEVFVPAQLGSAPLKLQFDIGFGEVITPIPQEIAYPTILDLPDPKLRVYPWETVIAEKFEAMVDLGMRNNRMKDFYDIAELASRLEFEGSVLAEAVRKTFEHRGTAIPESTPIALTEAFSGERQKRNDWTAFLRRHSLPNRANLKECCRSIEAFLMPIAQAIAQDTSPPDRWSGGKWS